MHFQGDFLHNMIFKLVTKETEIGRRGSAATDCKQMTAFDRRRFLFDRRLSLEIYVLFVQEK